MAGNDPSRQVAHVRWTKVLRSSSIELEMVRPKTHWMSGISAARGGSSSCELVDAPRRAREEVALLARRGAGGQLLERIPNAGVTDPHLVDREVALEGAASSAEPLDARLDEWPPLVGEFCRRWRAIRRHIVECGKTHHHATELDRDVGARGDGRHEPAPFRQHLRLLASEGSVAERHAAMIHDDVGIWAGASECQEVGMLMVEDQRVEAEAHPGEHVEACLEILAQVVARSRAMMIVADDRVRVEARRVAHAAEAA